MNEQQPNAKFYKITQRVIFSESDAKEMLACLKKVSTRISNHLNDLNKKLNSSNKLEIQTEINDNIQKWADHARRLGAVPTSLYQVRFYLENDKVLTWNFSNPEEIF